MKTNFKKYGTIAIAVVIANLFLVNKSIGQTATVYFDYTGNNFSCGGDPNYTSTSGASVTVPTTSIPAAATITGISFSASAGNAFGTTTFTFTLNGTSIGSFSASGTCQTKSIPSVSIPLFNKTGPNILIATFTGGTSPGVSNATFTVNYTTCTSPTSVSATASPNSICAGSTLTLTGAATGATSWSWTGPNGFTSTDQSPTISNITAAAGGVYHLTASNSCGSAAVANTLSVTVNSLPSASVAGQSNLSCYLSGTGSIALSATGGSGSGYSFSIDNGNPSGHYYNATGSIYIPGASITTSSNTGTFSGLPAGTYKIRVMDGNGCESKQVQ